MKFQTVLQKIIQTHKEAKQQPDAVLESFRDWCSVNTFHNSSVKELWKGFLIETGKDERWAKECVWSTTDEEWQKLKSVAIDSIRNSVMNQIFESFDESSEILIENEYVYLTSEEKLKIVEIYGYLEEKNRILFEKNISKLSSLDQVLFLVNVLDINR